MVQGTPLPGSPPLHQNRQEPQIEGNWCLEWMLLVVADKAQIEQNTQGGPSSNFVYFNPIDTQVFFASET